MAEQYFVTCGCGTRVRVALFNAGTTIRCPSCEGDVPVPDTVRLKELAGDRYPMLRPIEKIRRAVAEAEPPFDGVCHACGHRLADHEVPITIDAMVDRVVDDHGGISPTITGGIKVWVGASEERWEATTFPLLLCRLCHAEFQSARSRATSANIAKALGLLALLAGFLCFAYWNIELVAALAGLFSIVGVIALAVILRRSRRGDHFLMSWIRGIRWVPEALESEDEYELSVGKSHEYRPQER